MRGLLADVNVQGHAWRIRRLLIQLDLWPILTDLTLEFSTLRMVFLPTTAVDRSLWNFCQTDAWVLLTDNRNQDGPNSLEATLRDSWQPGCMPVLTLSDKDKLEHDRDYALRVAADVAELLFGVHHGEYCDRPRIYVPL